MSSYLPLKLEMGSMDIFSIFLPFLFLLVSKWISAVMNDNEWWEAMMEKDLDDSGRMNEWVIKEKSEGEWGGERWWMTEQRRGVWVSEWRVM